MKARILSQRQMAQLCRELSLLLGAGLTLGESAALLSQEPGENQQVLVRLTEGLDQGASLAGAMEDAAVFPAAVSGMVRIGETTGRLEEALTSLADYYEENEKLIHGVKTALLYPSLMLLMLLAVVGAVLAFVLPVFDSVYASMGAQLTGISAGLLRLGLWLRGSFPALLAVLVALAAAVTVLALWEEGRHRGLLWLNRRFSDRGIARKFTNARILQGLSMASRSGLGEAESLLLARELLKDNPGGAARVAGCAEALEEGASFAHALTEAAVLTAAQGRLLGAGSRSGGSDRVLRHLAADTMEEARQSLELLVSKVEPAMVLLGSTLIGVILLSAVLPLMNILASLG